MKATVVAAGNETLMKDASLEYLKDSDLIISVDGGLHFLEELDILPDVVLGDFDSVKNLDFIYDGKTLKSGIELLEYPIKKNDTDLELALNYLLDKGYKDYTILGGTGTRMDHSLCNIFLLERFSRKGLFGRIVNATNRVEYWMQGEYYLEKTSGEYYHSFLAMPDHVYLTLQGFEYELDGALVERGSSLGLSNHILADQAYVKVDGKGVYSIQSKD